MYYTWHNFYQAFAETSFLFTIPISPLLLIPVLSLTIIRFLLPLSLKIIVTDDITTCMYAIHLCDELNRYLSVYILLLSYDRYFWPLLLPSSWHYRCIILFHLFFFYPSPITLFQHSFKSTSPLLFLFRYLSLIGFTINLLPFSSSKTQKGSHSPAAPSYL